MIFARSERLLLRRPCEEDFESFLRSWDDPDMTRYTGRRPNVAEFIAGLIAEMQAKEPGDVEPQPWFQMTMERRDDGVVVGDVGIGFGVPGERQVELGYRVHPDHQRRGFAREALAAAIDYLIEHHAVHRFVGIAATPNEASKAVLRALGFRHEGHFRQSFWCNGEWLDDDYFALLASEWNRR